LRLTIAERNEQNDIQALNRTIPVASSATGKAALWTFGLTLPLSQGQIPQALR